MRALHVSTNRDLGGGERQVLALVEGSRRRGVDAHLVARTAGACLRAAEERGIPVRGIAPAFAWDPRTIATLARRLRADRFDAVHLHDGAAASLGVAAARLARVPAILHRRIASPLRNGLLSRWKHAPHRVALFVAVSESAASALRESGIPADRIAVVPSGVDVARLDALPRGAGRALLPDADEGLRLGTVGKLAPKKGLDVVLRAFARIVERRPGARLLVVGDGPERGALEALARDLGVAGRTVFAGVHADAAALVADLDLFLFASEREGSPGAVREAMALRVPVVAADASGTVEVLGETGCIVPRGDAPALAEAALALLDDAGRRKALVTAARARVVERSSMDAMVERTLAVTRAATEGGSPREARR